MKENFVEAEEAVALGSFAVAWKEEVVEEEEGEEVVVAGAAAAVVEEVVVIRKEVRYVAAVVGVVVKNMWIPVMVAAVVVAVPIKMVKRCYCRHIETTYHHDTILHCNLAHMH